MRALKSRSQAPERLLDCNHLGRAEVSISALLLLKQSCLKHSPAKREIVSMASGGIYAAHFSGFSELNARAEISRGQ